jgi:hypothetical protein
MQRRFLYVLSKFLQTSNLGDGFLVFAFLIRAIGVIYQPPLSPNHLVLQKSPTAQCKGAIRSLEMNRNIQG